MSIAQIKFEDAKIELKTLFEMGRGTSNMTPLLKTTGGEKFVWSWETRDSSTAWLLEFRYVNYGARVWSSRVGSYGGRAFAVRSRGL